ncbi:MAG: hypothetical protein JRF62_13770 [Deltaproteobacteria bacterium]|nr:hypothetical protein [Deltaproteobacteria bacterium]
MAVLCLKSQITSTKLQINLKFQITNSKPVQRIAQMLAPRERLFFLFGILNLGHAQRRRLRRVLLFICFLGFVFWDFNKSMNFQQSKSPLGQDSLRKDRD